MCLTKKVSYLVALLNVLKRQKKIYAPTHGCIIIINLIMNDIAQYIITRNIQPTCWCLGNYYRKVQAVICISSPMDMIVAVVVAAV